METTGLWIKHPHGEAPPRSLDYEFQREGVQMTYDDIVALLGYAGAHEHPVPIITRSKPELVWTPLSVDTPVTAHEVSLRPAGDDETEIAVSLAAIQAV